MMFSFFLIFTLYATSRLHHRAGLCYYLSFFVIKEAASVRQPLFSSQQETEIIVFCEVFHAVHD